MRIRLFLVVIWSACTAAAHALPPLPGDELFERCTAQEPASQAPEFEPYRALAKVAPEYPSAAFKQGIEGALLVEFTVTATGAVEDVKVIESGYTHGSRSAHESMEKAAAEAVRQFRYKPSMRDGQPVAERGVRNLITFYRDERWGSPFPGVHFERGIKKAAALIAADEPDEAFAFLDKEIARRKGDDVGRAGYLYMRAVAHWQTGQPDQALATLREVEALLEPDRLNPNAARMLVYAAILSGNLLAGRGDWRPSVAAYRRALHSARRIQMPANSELALAYANLGSVSWHLGDGCTARESLGAAIEMADALQMAGAERWVQLLETIVGQMPAAAP